MLTAKDEVSNAFSTRVEDSWGRLIKTYNMQQKRLILIKTVNSPFWVFLINTVIDLTFFN